MINNVSFTRAYSSFGNGSESNSNIRASDKIERNNAAIYFSYPLISNDKSIQSFNYSNNEFFVDKTYFSKLSNEKEIITLEVVEKLLNSYIRALNAKSFAYFYGNSKNSNNVSITMLSPIESKNPAKKEIGQNLRQQNKAVEKLLDSKLLNENLDNIKSTIKFNYAKTVNDSESLSPSQKTQKTAEITNLIDSVTQEDVLNIAKKVFLKNQNEET